MTPEHRLQNEILLALGSRADVRLFRNNVGLLYGGQVIARTDKTITLLHPRPIHAGLCVGSGDLIGWRTLQSGIAQFLSVEVKAAKGRIQPEQLIWRSNVERAGGCAGVVRSVEEAVRLLS